MQTTLRVCFCMQKQKLLSLCASSQSKSSHFPDEKKQISGDKSKPSANVQHCCESVKATPITFATLHINWLDKEIKCARCSGLKYHRSDCENEVVERALQVSQGKCQTWDIDLIKNKKQRNNLGYSLDCNKPSSVTNNNNRLSNSKAETVFWQKPITLSLGKLFGSALITLCWTKLHW